MTRLGGSVRERFALLRTRLYWNNRYDWSDEGDEWSSVWGGTPQMWWGAIYPRVHAFLPAPSVLEIAPGYGRCSEYLALLAGHLVLVDIASACIDACRDRFAEYDHVEYHVNDGKSLAMVGDASIDVVFSYDSLVHAPNDTLDAYIGQLPRILKPDGIAFLHHSNLGAYQTEGGPSTHDDLNGRDKGASAEHVREVAIATGLSCFSQELIKWGGDDRYSDAISAITPAGSAWDRDLQVVENPDFMAQGSAQAVLADLYGPPRP
jgi:SAM-dependent methyltransferase